MIANGDTEVIIMEYKQDQAKSLIYAGKLNIPGVQHPQYKTACTHQETHEQKPQ